MGRREQTEPYPKTNLNREPPVFADGISIRDCTCLCDGVLSHTPACCFSGSVGFLYVMAHRRNMQQTSGNSSAASQQSYPQTEFQFEIAQVCVRVCCLTHMHTAPADSEVISWRFVTARTCNQILGTVLLHHSCHIRRWNFDSRLHKFV